MAWTNTDVDTIVTNAPAYLHGLVLLCNVTGGDVTLYDGTDETAGRKILTAEGQALISPQLAFYPPLVCDRGLYVAVGDDVLEVTVHWDPIPRE